MTPIVVKMKDLPQAVQIVGEDGKRKTYQLVPAGKLGACLNKAADPAKK